MKKYIYKNLKKYGRVRRKSQPKFKVGDTVFYLVTGPYPIRQDTIREVVETSKGYIYYIENSVVGMYAETLFGQVHMIPFDRIRAISGSSFEVE